jgi:hypothetical protein
VLLLKSKKHLKVFGGFTDIPWTKKGGFKTGNGNSFLFSLDDDFNFIKYKCLNKEKEVYHCNDFIDFGSDNLIIYG